MSKRHTLLAGNQDGRYLATLIVTLVVLSAVIVPIQTGVFGDSESPMQAQGYKHTITYHYSTTDVEKTPVTVPYSGIAATEYNPEYWDGTGNVPEGVHNWVGPSAQPLTVNTSDIGSENDHSITIVSAKAVKNSVYTINFPTSHSISTVDIASGASDISIAGDKHSFTLTLTHLRDSVS